uniref:Cytochrome P450 n=1 Tax=Strigamia maritima TaxID=126957 RepID=T1J9Q6_STRMM
MKEEMDILNYLNDYNQLQFWIGFFLGLIALLYIYNTWYFDYWKRQGVSGSKPRFIMGTLLPIWKYSLDYQDVTAMKKFGKIYGGFVGRSPVLYVADPELLRQILVKDFATFPNRRNFGLDKDEIMGNMLQVMKDEKWKMVRNTLTPTYTSGKLKQMVGLIEECLENFKASLKISAETGEPIEFTKKFPVLTLDVIASVAFGMKINCIDNPNTDFVVHAQKAFRGNVKLMYILFLFPFLFTWLGKLVTSPFRYFATIANQTIDMRLKNKDFTRKDFLQIMLEAEIPNDPTKENQSTETDQKKTLSREIVVSQTILFILAGHETTSTTLNFLAYELAQYQDIQEKLIKEVDEVMTHTKGKLSYEGVASMQYLDMVTSETLRKYPPAIRLERVCEDDEYKLNGITIRKGMPIIIPAYAMHHNPEFYPNPNIFDPERFSPEMKAQRNPFTYLPFGAGPRNCIAKRFALLETKLVIVHMLYNYRFHTCPETEYPLKMNKGTGLLQPISVKLVLQKRVDKLHFDETVEINQ